MLTHLDRPALHCPCGCRRSLKWLKTHGKSLADALTCTTMMLIEISSNAWRYLNCGRCGAYAFVGSSPTSPTTWKLKEKLCFQPLARRPFSCRVCCCLFPFISGHFRLVSAAPCNMLAT